MNKKLIGLTIASFIFYAPFASAQITQHRDLGNGYIRVAGVGQITDTVSVWGDVGRSGRYIIPEGTSLPQLISFSHGFSPVRGRESDIKWAKKLIEVKISHYDKDRKKVVSKLFKYKYKNPIPAGMFRFDLQSNDIVTLQVTQKPSFADYVKIIAPIVGIVATSVLLYEDLK